MGSGKVYKNALEFWKPKHPRKQRPAQKPSLAAEKAERDHLATEKAERDRLAAKFHQRNSFTKCISCSGLDNTKKDTECCRCSGVGWVKILTDVECILCRGKRKRCKFCNKTG